MELDEETRDALGLGSVYERTRSGGHFSDDGRVARDLAWRVAYQDEYMRLYRQLRHGAIKASAKAYKASEQGKAAEARYVASDKRKASNARYLASDKAKARLEATKADRAEWMRLDRKAKKLGMTVAQYRVHMAKVVQMPVRKAAKKVAA